MSKKRNCIDFFKHLVCPDNVRSGKNSFSEWCNNVVSEKEKYLKDRTFLLLEFYYVFKRVYKYANKFSIYVDEITCKTNSDKTNLLIEVLYNDDAPSDFYNDTIDHFKDKMKIEGFNLSSEWDGHNTINLKFEKE